MTVNPPAPLPPWQSTLPATYLMKTQIALDAVRGEEDLAFACQYH